MIYFGGKGYFFPFVYDKGSSYIAKKHRSPQSTDPMYKRIFFLFFFITLERCLHRSLFTEFILVPKRRKETYQGFLNITSEMEEKCLVTIA